MSHNQVVDIVWGTIFGLALLVWGCYLLLEIAKAVLG